MTRGWRLVRARRRAVPASARRFATRARRHRLRRAAPWLAAAVVVCLAGVAALVVWGTSVFGVTNIKIEGTGITSPESVRAAAGVPSGTPLARVDTGAVARRILRLPPIRQASVDRVWPRSITIRVVERTAVAVVPVDDGGVLALDETGVAFQRLPTAPGGLPVVRLAAPSPGDAATRGALSVLRSLPDELRSSLVAVWGEGPARIRLELVDHRTIVWGDATDNDVKARVALELLRRKDLTENKTVYDVSAPYVPTVR